MVSKSQLDRIMQLRAQGWTQTQIAEDPLVDMSPQSVSYHLKKLREQSVSPSQLKIIQATGFQPKDTVVTFGPTEFESLRENDELYATGQDLYELRGGIIHKTTLPAEIETSIYPEIADIISVTPDFTYLPDRQSMIEEMERKGRTKSSKHWGKMMKWFLHSRPVIVENMMEQQEREKRKRLELREEEEEEDEDWLVEPLRKRTFLIEIFKQVSDLLPDIHGLYFDERIEDFYPEMPPVEEVAKLVRFVAENNLTAAQVNASMNSMTSTPGHDSNEHPTSEEHDYTIVVRAFDALGIAEEDIDYCFIFGTLDPVEIRSLKTSGAPNIKLMKEMETEGFSSWDAYQSHLDEIMNSSTPISVDSFPNLSSEGTKYNLKIIDAVERENLEDALTSAWTRFEIHARKLWEFKGLGDLPQGEGSTKELMEIIVPLVARKNMLQIVDQARLIRNAEVHGNETELILGNNHIRVVLEVTEKIIVALG